MTRPFEGVKILDFTQVLAGPYASYQLALLGADVIKVERREGEDMRRTPLSREWAERGLAPGWQAINGNKRSLTLDLQKPEAIAIVKQLAAQADVVMENFRPGVMDKLGIGYAALSAINPRLIYCAISGFGQTGPERLGAGYDGKIQALSGIMAITGHEETGPTRAGFAVCDVLSGATAAFGVSSALFQRTHTGKGQLVDVSMLEATLAFLSGQVADYIGRRPSPATVRQSGGQPQADRQSVQGGRRLSAARGQQREAIPRADDRARPRRRAGRPALRRLVRAPGKRAGAARHHRGSAREEGSARMGEDPRGGRRALRQHLEGRGGDRSSADRGARRHSGDRYALWPPALCRQRLPARPWRRQARSHGARAQRPHRRGADLARL